MMVLRSLQSRGCQPFKRFHRLFATSVSSDISSAAKSTPLSQPLPGLPKPIFATVGSSNHETKITVLENGLRVASENRYGKFSTVGVVIDSGSRYEVAYPSGVSHFLEKLAFGATQEYGDRDKIMQVLEKHGGICDCQSSRDTFIYAASIETSALDTAIKVLGEVILRPKLTPQEIDDARLVISFELENMEIRPEQEPLLLEMIHAAAYRDNTLGLPKVCPQENVTTIDQSIIYTFLNSHYDPSRMVLAGVGVEHEALVECAQKYFVEKKPIWVQDSSLVIPGRREIDRSLAQYTGGMVKVEKDLSDVSLGPNPMPELAHIVLGVESGSHQHDDFVALCVLSMMMGGGGSFSAGGPGKGMYTRLYTNALNRYHWMHNATAYNHAYADSGVFCIHASSHPSQLRELVDVITRELVAMAGIIEHSELSRAKKQLQSMLLMNLESRPVVFEDIARQVLATGKRKRTEEFIDKIRSITAEDIQRVASRMLKTKPSVAALGDLRRLPEYQSIESALSSADGKLPRRGRFSVFH
ncbi:mitochondrial-processing peptidase subunit alpha-like [Daphnia pulicaria]|uniref:mitochondrial-processing peptidase subunit alpha-like n=1 Tax=Daphnia pulicaria TaxID=35523 RepID=UPI001EECA5B8|nr:mitochondrial-processing peptidase subunit alpha-like [Daphnia pulicaria]